MALGTVCLSLLLLVVHHAHSSYVALAPSTFQPGWTYTVQLTVTNVSSGGSVTVRGNILNSKNESVADGNVIINDGASKKLDMPVNASINPDDGYSYTLKLVGSGGLTFTDNTSINIDFTTKLVFVQTDKRIYKPGQIVRFRVLVVDKDLVPQKSAKNITIENPGGSALVQHYDNGSQLVYEGTFPLAEFPDLGDWKIKVKFEDKIAEEISFMVDEYVLPKFEVTAEADPSFLVQKNDRELPENTNVTVMVTATYTYGKGVMGTLKLKTNKQEHITEITDSSGKLNVKMNLTKELKATATGQIYINVSVTDETHRTYSTQAIVRIERSPVKMELDKARSDQVYHYGMPATFAVMVTDPIGLPLTDEKYKHSSLNISLTAYDDETNTQTTTFTWSPGQLITWTTANIMFTADSIKLNASLSVGGQRYELVEYIKKYQTVGNATLDLSWKSYSPKLAIGSTVVFTVSVSNSADFSTYTYLIVSRGNIQKFGSASVGDNSVEVTTDMCPNGRLIVYGITATSSTSATPEIIADSLKLKLEYCQDTKVVPSALDATQKTGSNATISIDVSWTNPNRNEQVGEYAVYVLAVDKSILLLQQSNDLTPAEVDQKLEKFDQSSENKGGGGPIALERAKRRVLPNQQPSNTGQLLQNAGLKVLADIDMKDSPRWDYPVVAFGNARRGEVLEDSAVENGLVEKESEEETDEAANTVTVRKDFPDTWIWKTAMTDANGQLSMVETLPDSITSWVISAFAVRDNTELAVTSHPFELSAFIPFFVSLNLPYSIRRSESFEMRATVFNYEDFDMNVTVMLGLSRNYDVSGSATKTVQVRSNTASSVSFLIVTTKATPINITVTASGQQSDNASNTFTDTVTRELIVRPEGVMQTSVFTSSVILREAEPFIKIIDLKIPGEIVPNSTTTMAKVTGDMMGNALGNMEGLVQQPTGCGEQNMITTVPNIYALMYLQGIGEIGGNFDEEQAKKYMSSGVTKQMQQYRWPDGGYSVFGPAQGGRATIWLTAFVLRSFAQAKQFIPATVNMDLMMGDINFLLTHQAANGSFIEIGKVYHEEMKGGTGGKLSLPVYVTMCLLEAQKFGFEVEASNMTAAVNYVKNIANGNEVKTKPFLAAITAYTLALHNSTDEATVNKLIGYVAREPPWEKNTSAKPKMSKYSFRQAGPSDVEITAYSILALLTVGKIAVAHSPVMWLQEQQNGNGGYSSTQDTVVALQAISEFAVSFSGTAGSTVSITTLDPVTPTKTVTINSNNKALLQIIELPDDTQIVNVSVHGPVNSFAVVKIVKYYYTIPTEEPPGNKLDISTTVTRSGPQYKVRIYLRTDPRWDYNNMMIVHFFPPSGTEIPDIMEARKQNPNVMRIERTKKDNQYNFYLNEPLNGQDLQFWLEQTIRVEDRKPGTAVYYAYYNTEYMAESDVVIPLSCSARGLPSNCDETTTKKPTSRAAHYDTPRLLLTACVCLLLSLLIAF